MSDRKRLYRMKNTELQRENRGLRFGGEIAYGVLADVKKRTLCPIALAAIESAMLSWEVARALDFTDPKWARESNIRGACTKRKR